MKGWGLDLERERTGKFKGPGVEGNAVSLTIEEGRTEGWQGRSTRKQRGGSPSKGGRHQGKDQVCPVLWFGYKEPLYQKKKKKTSVLKACAQECGGNGYVTRSPTLLTKGGNYLREVGHWDKGCLSHPSALPLAGCHEVSVFLPPGPPSTTFLHTSRRALDEADPELRPRTE